METSIPSLKKEEPQWMQHVSILGSKSPRELVTPDQLDLNARNHEQERFFHSLTRQYGKLPQWGPMTSPYPILFPALFFEELRAFHEVLAIALNNIVERWWKDPNADFPSRMPLDSRAEDLLKWLDQRVKDGTMHPFEGHQGNWRSDLLFPRSQHEDSSADPLDFCVCEINARFPGNRLLTVAYSTLAIANSPWQHLGIQAGCDYKLLLKSNYDLFDRNLPVHFLHSGLHDPPDISEPWMRYLGEKGHKPKFVKPCDLRLVPSTTSKTGLMLCCIFKGEADARGKLLNHNGEVLEEVHQIYMQLIDHELFSLPVEIVRHIALRCMNDPRSIFIVHDKRILGIIQQELKNFIADGVLTFDQCEILRRHLVPTILPGSSEFSEIARRTMIDPKIKDGFILKPARDAKGFGVVPGRDMTTDQWKSFIGSLEGQRTDPTDVGYVLQPLVDVVTPKWFWDEDRKLCATRSVGTYFSLNGKFISFGGLRADEATRVVIGGPGTGKYFYTVSLG